MHHRSQLSRRDKTNFGGTTPLNMTTPNPHTTRRDKDNTHTTHQKHRVTEINLELAAEAEMPNQPEEDL